jgi:hypothetical protein
MLIRGERKLAFEERSTTLALKISNMKHLVALK